MTWSLLLLTYYPLLLLLGYVHLFVFPNKNVLTILKADIAYITVCKFDSIRSTFIHSLIGSIKQVDLMS